MTWSVSGIPLCSTFVERPAPDDCILTTSSGESFVDAYVMYMISKTRTFKKAVSARTALVHEYSASILQDNGAKEKWYLTLPVRFTPPPSRTNELPANKLLIPPHLHIVTFCMIKHTNFLFRHVAIKQMSMQIKKYLKTNDSTWFRKLYDIHKFFYVYWTKKRKIIFIWKPTSYEFLY